MADTPIEVPLGTLTLAGQGVNLSLPLIISDSLNFSGTLVTTLTALHIRGDTFRVLDAPKVGWKAIINESFDLSELQLVDWIVPLVDQLFTDDVLIVSGVYQTLLAEILETQDTLTAWQVFNDILAENFDLSESLIDLHKKVTILLDLLSLKETVVNTGTFQSFLADTLSLKESLERLFKESLSEAFDLSDVVTESGIFLTLLSEGFTASDIVAEIFTATTKIVDTFQGTDSNGVSGTFFVLSNDELIFKSELVISGEVFACWVLTTKNYNPSVYSNYDFNSYARLGEKLYGARQDGIYLLEGADDAGVAVHTGLLFDFANMDIPQTKRLRTIHLGSKTSKASVQVATDRNIQRTYTTMNQRTVIGKEVRGKYWTVAVEDVENLKSMELNVVLLSKSR